MPASAASNVLFPAPLGPITAVSRPGSMVRLTLSSPMDPLPCRKVRLTALIRAPRAAVSRCVAMVDMVFSPLDDGCGGKDDGDGGGARNGDPAYRAAEQGDGGAHAQRRISDSGRQPRRQGAGGEAVNRCREQRCQCAQDGIGQHAFDLGWEAHSIREQKWKYAQAVAAGPDEDHYREDAHRGSLVLLRRMTEAAPAPTTIASISDEPLGRDDPPRLTAAAAATQAAPARDRARGTTIAMRHSGASSSSPRPAGMTLPAIMPAVTHAAHPHHMTTEAPLKKRRPAADVG